MVHGGITDIVAELLKKLAAERFFGSVELQFQNGRVCYIRKTECIKLPSHTSNLNPKYGIQNERDNFNR